MDYSSEESEISESSMCGLQQDDIYVWPWMGIIVNIVCEPGDTKTFHCSEYWLKRLDKFKPLGVHIFSDGDDLDAQAVVEFNNDWNGFMNATEFEKLFVTERCGKRDWSQWKTDLGSDTYGWRACADDYYADGPIGDFLRNKGQLRTVSDTVQEAAHTRNNVLENLATEIDITIETLNELHNQYNKKTMSLSRMLVEKDKLHSAYLGGLFLVLSEFFDTCFIIQMHAHLQCLVYVETCLVLMLMLSETCINIEMWHYRKGLMNVLFTILDKSTKTLRLVLIPYCWI
jgi:hypothetical protein